jgi:hypothetical protein
MQTQKYKTTVGFLALAFLLVVAGTAFSIHFGVSQFSVIKGGRDRTVGARITNPTATEMFAIAIAYATDEDFLFCEGHFITPHGTALVTGLDDSSGPRHIFEVFAFPSNATRVVHDHKRGIGSTGGHGRKGDLLDPSLFRIEASSAAFCVCDVLENKGFSRNLLRNYGANCS